MKTYIRFLFGRRHPVETLDDCGFEGPVIGPVGVQWRRGRLRLDERDIIQYNGLLYFAGNFYEGVEFLHHRDKIVQQAIAKGTIIYALIFWEQLKADKLAFQLKNIPPKIILYCEGGVIHQTISNREDLQIKILDFDDFESGNALPYVDVPYNKPDEVVHDKDIDNTPMQKYWEEKYQKQEVWKIEKNA